MKKKTIRVLCVDDHAFLVEGLRTRFELEEDIECVGRLATAEDLVVEARRLRPDLVLLDIEMPGPDPFEAAADLHRQCPEVRTIILSAYVRDHYISAAFRAGVWGYFCKSDEASVIIDGMRQVARGTVALGPKVQSRCQPAGGAKAAAARRAGKDAPTPPGSRLDLLTPREQEVLRLIGKGHARTEIARLLSRSPKTVDGHREAIMAKLDMHDRGELVRFAIREGLVEA